MPSVSAWNTKYTPCKPETFSSILALSQLQTLPSVPVSVFSAAAIASAVIAIVPSFVPPFSSLGASR